ncbi:hypothetical protein [Rhizobium sp. BK376]|uniref:hypothetical protein n=1 Tax=Rhizobium sp. BK376 TaxID=2512149 RepID=UPI001FDEE356|nr:hypothetical protein [Rhizobium sp. BK376]
MHFLAKVRLADRLIGRGKVRYDLFNEACITMFKTDLLDLVYVGFDIRATDFRGDRPAGSRSRRAFTRKDRS